MPLLSPTTVQAVRDLPIATVVSPFVPLKPKGQNQWGSCPFHDEKSPSFEVHNKTNTFYCFGCLAKGDGIEFIIKKQGLDFVAAVEALAKAHGVPIEYEETTLTPQQQAAEELCHQEKKEVTAALEWAARWFAANQLPNEFTAERGISHSTVLQAGLGYAPAGGRMLLEAANKAGYLAPVLVRASLVREVKKGTSTSHVDFFQDRVMFPLRNVRGYCVAFSGRYTGPLVPEAQFQPPKSINSGETTWIKGAHFYGLDHACSHIRKAGFAFVVEGQMDVLQMWQHKQLNTVGQGGTALSDEQILLLKRYTQHAMLVYDNDPAGRKAIKNNASRLLAAGFQVSVLVPADATAKGEANSDPDSYLLALGVLADKEVASKKKVLKALDSDGNKLTAAQYLAFLVDEWVRSRQDYITAFAVADAMGDGELGPREKATAISALGELLESLPGQAERMTYYEEVAKAWPIFKKTYKLQKRKAEPTREIKKETKDALQRLTSEQMTASMDDGFFEKEGGYWYYDTQKGREICICRFTIQFLFFVVSNSRPKYVCMLNNSFGRSRMGVFSTDDLVSKDAFNKAIGRYHGFVFEGSQYHFNRIKLKLWAGCPEALEANYLGWNSANNLYAWNNGLLQNGTFYKCDKYGVVTLRKLVSTMQALLELPHESQLEIDGTVPVLNTPAELIPQLGEDVVEELIKDGKVIELSYHYLPSGGSIQLGSEESDDLAKKFKHFQIGSLTFHDWAQLVCDVHGADNGRTMVAFFVAVLFRSIIHKANGGYFPILFHFGLKGSGKTQAALSLMHMFGTPPHDDGIGLESGSTTTGMQRFLSSISDGLVWLNEYKNSLPVRTIGMLKDLAGGSGKMTGMNTSGNETKTTPPRSAALISGQDLPTADVALLDRCILNEFDKREHRYETYKQLSDIQSAGQTTFVTCEVLNYRDVVRAGYKKEEPKCTIELRTAGKELLGEEPNSRAVLNLTSILTPCKLLMDAGLTFPFTYEELKNTLLGKMEKSANIQNVSDEVETFFLTVAGLMPQMSREDEHYKIEKDAQGRILLYVRVATVHGHYQHALRTQGGAPMGISALRSYMQKHRSFVGEIKQTLFSSPEVPNATSALIFDYQMLREQGIEFRTRIDLRNVPLARVESKSEDKPAKVLAPTITNTLTVPRDINAEVLAFIGNLAVHDDNPRERYQPKKLFDAFNMKAHSLKVTDSEFHYALRLGETISTIHGQRIVTWVQENGKNFYEVALGKL